MWKLHPSKEHDFFGLRPTGGWGDMPNTEIRAKALASLVVCRAGHVTMSGDAGSWCIRSACRSTETRLLADYPAIIVYMLLSETGPREDRWTDEDVYRMAQDLGAWPSR